MTIAVLHNYYQYRGGEDSVFEAETALLEARGHRVIRYTVHNDAVNGRSALWLAQATVWNRETYAALQDLFRRENPDVVHCHNTLPLLSPSAYTAANDAGIPVVQTLHNYRLLCPNALFFRDGHVCEDCLGKSIALPGVRHKCYRESTAASALVAGMTALHRFWGTWDKSVTVYLALTDFARRKFIEGGLPAEKIFIKPNFVEHDAGIGSGTGDYALYVGRLSPEKGAMTLLEAWKQLPSTMPLVIVGDGPLQTTMAEFIALNGLTNVSLIGRKTMPEVMELMKGARCLVFPSTLYETFGKSMIEAFACGTPVICSRLGAMQELVEDGVTGFHFTVSNTANLAAKLHAMWQMPQTEYAQMRQNARHVYEQRYTAEQNMAQLEEIYRRLCS